MRNLWCSKVKLTNPWSSGIYRCIIFTGLWSLVDLVELHPITLILQVVQEYERAVIFRLGRVVGGAKGPGKENLIYSLQCTYYTVMQLYFVTWGLCVFAPCIDCHHHFLMLMFLLVLIFFVLGLFFLWPCIDEMQKVDLRVLSYDVPPQEVSILIYC